LLASLFGQIARGIAERRHITEAQVRGLIDKGPFSSEDAYALNLVDFLGGRDDTIAAAKAKAGGSGNLLGLDDYAAAKGELHRNRPTIRKCAPSCSASTARAARRSRRRRSGKRHSTPARCVSR